MSMERPDKRAAEQQHARCREVIDAVEGLTRMAMTHRGEVARLFEEAAKDSVRERLAALSVDELSNARNGIRVAALKKEGIETLADLERRAVYGIERINGIGPEMGAKITAQMTAIRAELWRHAKVRLDYDHRTPQTTAIVNHLYVLLQNRELFGYAQGLERERLAGWKQALTRQAPLTTSVRWLFTKKANKEAAIGAYAFLAQQLQEVAGAQLPLQYRQLLGRQAAFSGPDGWEDYLKQAAAYYTLLEQITGISSAEEAAQPGGLPAELVAEIHAMELDGSLMKTTLRHYQEFGTKFIVHQKRVLLGDEMGLGKTMQAIAAMAHYAATGETHFMVVCPVSVKVNWIREVEKHSRLLVGEIHGSDRLREYEEWKLKGGVAVTTYETLVRLQASEQPIGMLVVDEAHYVKNPKAARTKALLSHMKQAKQVLFMSGTPLENRVDELIFLIGCLNPALAEELSGSLALAKAPEFRQKMAPVYLRRVREDVLTELPEKLEKEQWCRLNQKELAVYSGELEERKSFMQIRKVSWNVPDLADSSKAQRLLELCAAAEEEKRRVIVFSYFLSTIERVQGLLQDKCYGPITGSVPSGKRQEIIDAFGESKAGSVLLCQIVAAGTGLNIQSASVVVLCEPQLKPSLENQAISRVFRMGQARSVLVHRLLAEGSIDERICELLREKSDIFERYAEDSVIDEANKAAEQAGGVLNRLLEEERKRLGIEEKEIESEKK